MPAVLSLGHDDTAQVLDLNLAAQPHVARLDAAELARLRGICGHHLVVREGAVVLGYLLAFTPEDAYDGEEFLAFRSLLAQPFIYIDQLVVRESARGRGVGRGLYEALARSTAARAARWLCCEVNVVPPNPGSLAFHGQLGFTKVQTLATRDGRIVELLHKPVPVVPG
jgi:predicted GNAT superfamily acetyltransferase